MDIDLERSNVVHIIPHNDAIDHTSDEDCVCGPNAQPVKRADGSVGWMIVHPSLDDREHGE